MSNKKTIFQTLLELKDLNIYKILIEYSGSGDSGGIDNVIYLDKNNDEIEGIEENYPKLNDELRDYVYDLLQDVEDWYNNEGGYGTVTIDLINNSYNIDNHIYYMQTEDYNHKGTLINE